MIMMVTNLKLPLMIYFQTLPRISAGIPFSYQIVKRISDLSAPTWTEYEKEDCNWEFHLNCDQKLHRLIITTHLSPIHY